MQAHTDIRVSALERLARELNAYRIVVHGVPLDCPSRALREYVERVLRASVPTDERNVVKRAHRLGISESLMVKLVNADYRSAVLAKRTDKQAFLGHKIDVALTRPQLAQRKALEVDFFMLKAMGKCPEWHYERIYIKTAAGLVRYVPSPAVDAPQPAPPAPGDETTATPQDPSTSSDTPAAAAAAVSAPTAPAAMPPPAATPAEATTEGAMPETVQHLSQLSASDSEMTPAAEAAGNTSPAASNSGAEAAATADYSSEDGGDGYCPDDPDDTEWTPPQPSSSSRVAAPLRDGSGSAAAARPLLCSTPCFIGRIGLIHAARQAGIDVATVVNGLIGTPGEYALRDTLRDALSSPSPPPGRSWPSVGGPRPTPKPRPKKLIYGFFDPLSIRPNKRPKPRGRSAELSPGAAGTSTGGA